MQIKLNSQNLSEILEKALDELGLNSKIRVASLIDLLDHDDEIEIAVKVDDEDEE